MLSSIFETLTTVFTQFIPLLGRSFVDMFRSVFLTFTVDEVTNAITVTGLNDLGILMVTFVGVALVIGIFGLVFRLFNRFRKSVR